MQNALFAAIFQATNFAIKLEKVPLKFFSIKIVSVFCSLNSTKTREKNILICAEEKTEKKK